MPSAPKKGSPEHQRAARAKQKNRAFDKLGAVCARCGIDDRRVFQIDHVDGGGEQDRKAGLRGKTGYTDVLNRPWRYQLLCANCHQIKSQYPDDF